MNPRRWFRFRLRTFFVLLTLFGVWLGVQVKWIRDRHAYLATRRSSQYSFQDPAGKPRAAPGGLWLLRERGVGVVNVIIAHARGSEIPPEAAEPRRLFPEAELLVLFDDGRTYLWRSGNPWPK